MNFKDIHIGALIESRIAEMGIDEDRICNFMKCSKSDLPDIYRSEDIPVTHLLKWSKLLEYDFFRLYSQHLILYSPPAKDKSGNTTRVQTKMQRRSSLPVFRKHVYTRQVIDFLIELIEKGEKTRQQVIDDYRIPKTTLYKWIDKYNKKEM